MEAKPCPFCGGTLLRGRDIWRASSRWVWCRGCGAEGPESTPSFPDPISAWNRRATDPLREALLWKHAAGELIWSCNRDDAATMEMATQLMWAARREVERLLEAQCPTS